MTGTIARDNDTLNFVILLALYFEVFFTYGILIDSRKGFCNIYLIRDRNTLEVHCVFYQYQLKILLMKRMAAGLIGTNVSVRFCYNGIRNGPNKRC